MDFITQPWSWYVADPVIALMMFLLYYFGEHFGMSSNLKALCSTDGTFLYGVSKSKLFH
ncbi:MAG: hypothetical protein WC389_14060 [Lutibacter sp.]|jgi:hypothetical protein